MIVNAMSRCQQATLITGLHGSGKTWALTEQLLQTAKTLYPVEDSAVAGFSGQDNGSTSDVGSSSLSGSLLMICASDEHRAVREKIDVNRPLGCRKCDVQTFSGLIRAIVNDFGPSVGSYTIGHKRALDRIELSVFLHRHLHQLPLGKYRPLHSPGDAVRPLLDMFSSLAHFCVEPEAYLRYVDALEAEQELVDFEQLADLEVGRKEGGAAKAIKDKRRAQLEDEAWREYVAAERDKANTYKAFEELKQRAEVTDYSDSILMARRILTESASARAELSLRLAHLFVDDLHEYSPAMMGVIKGIVSAGVGITAAADPYLEAWTPARNDNNTVGPAHSAIVCFKRTFPTAIEFPLGRTRGSAEAVERAMKILEPRETHSALKKKSAVARTSVGHRGERTSTDMSDRFLDKAFGYGGHRGVLEGSLALDRDSGSVTCLTFENEEQELTALGRRIRQMIKEGVSPTDVGVAVVGRWNMVNAVLAALSAAGVKAVGGSRFSSILDRETPRTLMSLLRCLVHPSESTPLLHLLMTCPAYALPAGELTAALEGHLSRYVPLRSFLKDIHLGGGGGHARGLGISEGARAVAGRLLADVDHFAEVAKKSGIREVMLAFLRHTEQLQRLEEPTTWEEEQEGLAVAALFDVTVMAEEQAGGDSVALVEPVLRLFRRHGMGYTASSHFTLEDAATLEGGLEATTDAVQVFAVRQGARVPHQSFHTVFIPCCNRASLPGSVRSARLPIPGPFRGVPEPRDAASVRASDQLSRLCHENRARAMLYTAVAAAREEVCFSVSARVSRGRSELVPSPFLAEILGRRTPREWKSSGVSTRSLPLALNEGSGDDGDGMKGPLALSFSSISSYDLCPYSYYLHHVLHVTPPANPRMVYGRAMHEAVAACLRGAAGDSAGPPPTLQAVLEEFKRHFEGCAFESASQLSTLEEEGSNGLESFLFRLLELQRSGVSKEGRRSADGAGGEPAGCAGDVEAELPPPRLLVERKFRIRVPEADVILSGVFDRVDVWPGDAENSPARRVSVTDYKSNVGTKEPQRMVRDSLQLRLYSLAAERLFGVTPAELVIESVEDGRKGISVPSPVDAKLALEAILTTAAGVRAENFQATPSFQGCTFCGFKHMCRHSAVTNATL